MLQNPWPAFAQLHAAPMILAAAILFLVPGPASGDEEDSREALDRLMQRLGAIADRAAARPPPIWASDPWEGDEAALRAWCVAMADTHLTEWTHWMIPGNIRGRGEDLNKPYDTRNYFEKVDKAFTALEAAAQPEALHNNSKNAARMFRKELGVFKSYGWNYSQALLEGATLSPPLGIEYADEMAMYVTPLQQVQDRWCLVDPEDRG